MKKSIFKKLSGLLAAAMFLGLIQITAFAEVTYDSDFSNKTDTIELVNLASFDGYGYTAEYWNGLGGRAADDVSLVNNVTGLPAKLDKALSGGFNLPYYLWVVNTQDSVRTLEMSALYGGDADFFQLSAQIATHPSKWQWYWYPNFVKIQDGIVYCLDNDTGIRCGKDEWIRIVIEEHYNDEDIKIYINGKEIQFADPGKECVFGNTWFQANIGFAVGEKDSERNGYLALDDVKIYDSAYVVTGNEQVSYQVDESLQILETEKKVIVDEGTPFEDILSKITTDAEYKIFTSHNSAEEASGDIAQNGNVIVFTSPDGKTYDYLTISTNADDKIIDYVPVAESTYYTNFGGNMTIERTGGLFAKEADNLAYVLRVQDKDSSSEISDRTNFTPDLTTVVKAESFTAEFSVAGEGNFDSLAFLLRPRYVKEDGSTELGYNTPIQFDSENGILNYKGNRIGAFNKGQWYRVAITIYPKSCTFDLYLNGTQINSGAKLTDGEIYGITGFEWFQVQSIYKAKTNAPAHNGMFALDDILIYYGAYQDNAESHASLECPDGTYYIDDAESAIYVSGIADMGDFVDLVVADYEMMPYTDSSFTEVAEEISEGNVIVVRSQNSYTYKYYTVKSPEFTFDSNIECYVNDEISNIIESNSTIKAKISAYAPAFSNKEGVLVLAVYKDGMLETVVMDDKPISDNTSFEVSAEVGETAGLSAKAMFLDSVDSLKPYVDSASFIVLE